MESNELKIKRADQKELLQLMRDGAHKICDYALERWYADKYKAGEAMRQKYVKEWEYKKEDINELYWKLRTLLGVE